MTVHILSSIISQYFSHHLLCILTNYITKINFYNIDVLTLTW